MELYNIAQSLLAQGSGWAILVFIGVLMVWRFDLTKTYSVFDQVRGAKVKTMEAFLSQNADTDGATRETILDVWTAYQFKAATGIYAEGKRRAALIAFHRTLEGTSSWELIRRGRPFLVLNNENEISVRPLSRTEKWEARSYAVLLIVALVVTFLCVVTAAILFYVTHTFSGTLALTAAPYVVFGFVAVYSLRPFNARKELSRQSTGSGELSTIPVNKPQE